MRKMNKSRLSFLVALYMVLGMTHPALVSAPSFAESSPAASSAKAQVPASEPPPNTGKLAPLQGAAQHSVSVAPMPLSLMQGAKFDESAQPKLTPGNVWYPIPSWMAGTWQFKTETVTDMYVYTDTKYPPVPFTLHNEFQRTMGFQKDKSGQVWNFVKAPFSYTAKVGNGLLSYINENSITVLKSNDGEVLCRLVGQDAIVNPDTQEILLSNQKECFTRHTPAGDDGLRVDGSTKIFDMDGKPKVLKLSNMLAVRLKPFEVVDSRDGLNYKELFAEFLKAQGKANLIP